MLDPSTGKTASEMLDVRRLAPEQRQRAADVLTRAFHDDPIERYVFPDPVERDRANQFMFAAVVHDCLAHGAVITDSRMAGVACWLAPGKTHLTLVGMLLQARLGVALALLRFRGQDRNRFQAVYNHIGEVHERVMPRPHWYLLALAVDPAFQGQGVGGKLVQPMLAQADATGVPCCLEPVEERNVAFYQRRGFEIIHHEPVSMHGGPVWYMAREPQKSHAV